LFDLQQLDWTSINWTQFWNDKGILAWRRVAVLDARFISSQWS